MKKICYLGLGHLSLALGIIGAFVPGLPTTVFLIIAVWAFGKSSEKLQQKILNHPKYGPTVRNWQEHGVIPVKAKILAGTMMLISWIICFVETHTLKAPIIAGVSMLAVFIYIVTRPSEAKSALASPE